MASDVMAVRLHLPQMRVLEVVEDTPARLVVGVESTLRGLRCPNCGFKCRSVHDRRASCGRHKVPQAPPRPGAQAGICRVGGGLVTADGLL